MKNFKKIFALLLALLMVSALFVGCADNNTPPAGDGVTDGSQNPADTDAPETPAEKVTIRVGGLKGPTSIGLVKLMEDDANGTTFNNYEFTVEATADGISPLLVKGELDMAAVPVNLASVLYKNTEGKVKLLAVNTLGVLYIVQKNAGIDSIEDLRGKTIYATGKGSTPEYNLRYILSANGIDPDRDVTIEFKSEATEIGTLMQSAESAVAMLPQPYVTIAKNTVEGLEIALNLTEEWEKLGTGSQLITGVMVVRADFLEKHPEAVAKFLEEYKASTEYVNANVEEGAALVEKYGLFKAAVAKTAIPLCNITFIAGEELREPVEKYLNILFEQKPQSVGGALPADDFYYEGK